MIIYIDRSFIILTLRKFICIHNHRNCQYKQFNILSKLAIMHIVLKDQVAVAMPIFQMSSGIYWPKRFITIYT